MWKLFVMEQYGRIVYNAPESICREKYKNHSEGKLALDVVAMFLYDSDDELDSFAFFRE